MRALSLRRRPADEDGATIVIVVISLIALFGMVVLVVDVGGLVVRRRELVNANDSAALAGAIAFAQKEGGALCGSIEDPAKSAADFVASTNVDGASLVSWDTDCDEQTVTVVYERDQQLFFAPVLGFGESATVNATATAQWGRTTGGIPMPVELDPVTTGDCVFIDPADPDAGFKPPGECPEGYWFDNGDLTSSGWGMMDLTSWSETRNASCNNQGGANLLGDWITQEVLIQVSLTSIPMYVCVTDGGKTPNWTTDLKGQVGKVFLFPVNDPSKMILSPPADAQYAIIAFAPMKVVAVYDVGKEEALAIGTRSRCLGNHTFSLSAVPGKTVDLDTYTGWVARAGTTCPSAATGKWAVDSAPKLYEAGTNKPINQGWTYNSGMHEITWTDDDSLPKSVDIEFYYRTGGACPGHTYTPKPKGTGGGDPNAYCLVLEWAGPQLIGTDPGPPGPGYGAQAVTLVK